MQTEDKNKENAKKGANTFTDADGHQHTDRRTSDNESPKHNVFIGLNGRRQTDRRTLKDRRRPWVNSSYREPERRYHIRRKTKFLRVEDKIEERHYDRRRDGRK